MLPESQVEEGDKAEREGAGTALAIGFMLKLDACSSQAASMPAWTWA